MPVQVSYPGVYIQEVSSGVHTITGVATSIAAFLGRTATGPINQPVRCLSYADFLRGFGGPHPLSDLAELLRSAYAPSSADVSFDDLLIPDTRHVHTHDQVTRFRFGSYAAATLALAAGIALWLMHLEEPKLTATAEQREQLVQSRSVAPLFAETFDSKTPTERIDRIVAIRSRELRQNRYATWSVR